MSIVSVHGPYTWGSKALVGGGASGAIATVNPSNGLIWTLIPYDKSQVAANYDWAYTGAAGTPASPILNTMQPVVTFPAGAHTVTLTLNGVAQAPFTINAVAGVAPLMQTTEVPDDPHNVTVEEYGRGQHPDGSVVEPLPGSDTYPDDGNGYDPGEHTVAEVLDYVEAHPDLAAEIYDAEADGKNRTTLLSHLEEYIPYDPADYSVNEVLEYAEASPDQLEDILAAERAGKNRSTLISHLEALRQNI